MGLSQGVDYVDFFLEFVEDFQDRRYPLEAYLSGSLLGNLARVKSKVFEDCRELAFNVF